MIELEMKEISKITSRFGNRLGIRRHLLRFCHKKFLFMEKHEITSWLYVTMQIKKLYCIISSTNFNRDVFFFKLYFSLFHIESLFTWFKNSERKKSKLGSCIQFFIIQNLFSKKNHIILLWSSFVLWRQYQIKSLC